VLRNLADVVDFVQEGDGSPAVTGVTWQDVHGHAYRDMVLEAPSASESEYLVWAANEASLTYFPSWSEAGSGSLGLGSLSVVDGEGRTYADGTAQVVVSDDDNRSLEYIEYLVVARGDVIYDDGGWLDEEDPSAGRAGTVPYLVFQVATQDTYAGLVTLSSAQLSLLDGGLSALRGDSIVAVRFERQEPTFWWTRNDKYETRFGWRAKSQRWEPWKGAPPTSLGVIGLDSIPLSPKPRIFPVGVLSPLHLRVGFELAQSTRADVRVVTEGQAPRYDWSSDTVDATLSQDGVLRFNPEFVSDHIGETVWVYQAVSAENTGDLGSLESASTDPLFLSPIPEKNDNPFLRIGNRRYLTPTLTDTDAELPLLSLAVGEVGVSLETGRIRFSQTDLNKALPTSSGFVRSYLDARVFYDGVALNAVPQPLKAAQALVLNSGDYYIPAGSPVPGLGVSGTLTAFDGTGLTPVDELVGVRPGGDTAVAAASGAVRAIEDGVGDTLIFSRDFTIHTINVVDFEADIPPRHKIKKGEAYVAKELGASGSLVRFSNADLKNINGQDIHFLQSTFTPSTWASDSTLYSRVQHVFRFEGDEELSFSLGGYEFTWVSAFSSDGTYTAEEVAASIQAQIATQSTGYSVALRGTATAENGRVVLHSNVNPLLIRVSPNHTGNRALGFAQGWYAEVGAWNPDSGVSFGFYRSHSNTELDAEVSDFKAHAKYNGVIQDKVSSAPFQFLPAIPLEDRPGLDTDVFFYLRNSTLDAEGEPVLLDTPVSNFEEVEYLFGESKLAWLSSKETEILVEKKTFSFDLGVSSVVTPTVRNIDGLGHISLAEEGGALTPLTYEEDFNLPQGGQTGQMLLTETFGAFVSSGQTGQVSSGIFTDSNADLSVVVEGSLFKIDGSWFMVTSVDGGITLTPTLEDSTELSWALYEGFSPNVYDPSLLVRGVLRPFSHLPSETFIVKQLTQVSETAPVAQAIERGRGVSLRYGIEGLDILLSPLRTVKLGVLSQDTLVVSVSDIRLSTGKFQIRVGDTYFEPSIVSAWSTTPVVVEVLGEGLTKGTLRFPQSVLDAYGTSQVYLEETFLELADLDGAAEFDPFSGELNVQAGEGQLYFAEQLLLGADVMVSAQTGACSLREPLQAEQVLELTYFQADMEGRKVGDAITEIVSFTHTEVATRVSATVYGYLGGADPIVTLGGRRLNYGGARDFYVEGSNIKFYREVPEQAEVKAISSVPVAFGGEVTFRSGAYPIYRPPFYIPSGKNRFGVRGDRASEFTPGQILKIGEVCHYIKSVELFAAEDITAVTLYPATASELGSRAPVNDVGMWLSDIAFTASVDGTATSANFGVLQSFPQAFAFNAVSRGAVTLAFVGDVSAFAKPGHLLEVAGQPYIVRRTALAEDGSKTFVTLSSPVRLDLAGTEPVKCSYLPLYYEQDTAIAVGAQTFGTDVRLISFPEGRELRSQVDYTFTPEGIQLAAGVTRGEQLLLHYTKLRYLEPFVDRGALIFPRIYASFKYRDAPSVANGVLNSQLQGRFFYRSPDSFYVRVTPLTRFVSETVTQAIQDLNSETGSVVPATPMNNWEFGRAGLLTRLADLLDKDRASRVMLSFYNETIEGFEQALETMTSGVIGDRSGKFRFWVGKDKTLPVPGYEDDISGQITPRYLWAEVSMQEAADTLWVLRTDPLMEPRTATLSQGELAGDLPEADRIDQLIGKQVLLIKNDVDDYVLVSPGKVTAIRTAFFPFFKQQAASLVAQMGEQHGLSRLFPTTTRAFFTTYPGIGSDLDGEGRYSWGTLFGGSRRSTYRKQIGQLENPVLGEITGVSDAVVFKRRARARVWGYFPTGVPGGAFPLAITDPVIIATPQLLRDFKIDPETGFPSYADLLSQGGEDPDLESGNPDLSVPGFQVGDQLSFGLPSGETYLLFSPETVDIFGQSSFTGVFVDSVEYGCVLTFRNVNSVRIADPNNLLIGQGPDQAIPLGEFEFQPGATIYAAPSLNSNTALSSPITTDDLEVAVSRNDQYVVGRDLAITKDGRVLDISLPSFADPSFIGLKEILGQNSPRPLQSLEAVAGFSYTELGPLEIPALRGEELDDTGDQAIPFVAVLNSELERLGDAAVAAPLVIEAEDGSGGYLYPDEILSTEGEILSAYEVWGSGYAEPAALIVPVDATPVAHGATDPGIGDVGRFDLVLVQPKVVEAGWQGIISVGEISTVSLGGGSYGSIYEPPRFVTPTTPPLNLADPDTGSVIRYTFDNAIVYTDDPGNYALDPQVAIPPGLQIIEDTGADLTILDFSSLTKLALNDGDTIGLGNLNELWSSTGYKSKNIFTFRLYWRTDASITDSPDPGLPSAGQVFLTIRIFGTTWTVTDYWGNFSSGTLTGFGITFGTEETPAGTVIENRQIHLKDSAIIDWGGGTPNQWFIPHAVAGARKTGLYGYEFSLSIDTFNSTADRGGSNTGWVGEDRLTFSDVWDMRHVKARGYTHPLSGVSLAGGLRIREVTLRDGTASTINDVVSAALTFVPRSTVATDAASYYLRSDVGGQWVARGADSEVGSIKVMALETNPNTSIVSADIICSAIPSTSQVDGDYICRGVGYVESAAHTQVGVFLYDTRLADIVVADGALANIEPGDLCVLGKTSPIYGDHIASTKTGTYLVRHAVTPTGGNPYRESSHTAWANSSGGWCPVQFPTIVEFDSGSSELTVSDYAGFEDSPVSIGGLKSGFESSGRLFIVLDPAALNASDAADFRVSVISCEYTSMSAIAYKFLGTGVYRWADNTAMTADEFAALAIAGRYVTGMSHLPIDVKGGELPSNNVVGYDEPGSVVSIAIDVPGTGYSIGDVITFTAPVAGVTAKAIVATVGGLGDITSVTITHPGTGYTAAPTLASISGAGVGADLSTTLTNHHSVYGIRFLELAPPVSVSGVALLFDGQQSGGGAKVHKPADAASGHLTVTEGTVWGISGGLATFVDSLEKAVYPSVPKCLSLDQLTTAQWKSLNVPVGSYGNGIAANDLKTHCLLPGAQLILADGATPGFYAQAGIFLEPSFPLPVLNMGTNYAHVVDDNNNMDDADVGVRNKELFYAANQDDITGLPEEVDFEIRRCRRWHEAQIEVSSSFEALRFAYEIRRGRITDWSEDDKGFATVRAESFTMDFNNDVVAPWAGDVWNDLQVYTGTNLGGFLDSNVNIHAGDWFRILDEEGDLIEQHEIAAVISDGRLLLRPPQSVIPSGHASNGGYRFEIWLRQAPVPHEQTNEQLLNLITAKEVHRTIADWDTEEGGYVPEFTPGDSWSDVANHLYDDKSVVGGTTYETLGVAVGDIVIVDPIGAIPNSIDRGSRAFGDTRVSTRAGYVAGSPSNLDDNRGFYRVLEVAGDHLVVDPVTTFSGDIDSDQVFPATEQAALGYVAYPTVNDSLLNHTDYVSPAPLDNREGQNDLRPTKVKNVLTYSEDAYSIRPFSYRIIRPLSLFEPETVDLILLMRERTLSLIDKFGALMRGVKGGSYFDFQDDTHIASLGDLEDLEVARGLLTNGVIRNLMGEFGVSPFANSSDALSILDRRFWIQDARLDRLVPNTDFTARTYDSGVDPAFKTDGGPYTSFSSEDGDIVRPLFPDRISEVLDTSEKFRALRLMWLGYRTHKTTGTLAAIRQFRAALTSKRAKGSQFSMLRRTVTRLNE
jgi:hypothetical protein